MSITIGSAETRQDAEIETESTSQHYLDPAELPSAIEETDEGIILDPRWLGIGASIVYPLEGQLILALRRDEETVEFYLLPDSEAQSGSDPT